MVLGEVITESQDDMLFWGREKPNARAPQHRQTRASRERLPRAQYDWFNHHTWLAQQSSRKNRQANTAEYANHVNSVPPIPA